MRIKTPPHCQCLACRWHGVILPDDGGDGTAATTTTTNDIDIGNTPPHDTHKNHEQPR